ncbi:DsbA family oxidoreductase [Pectobacterium aquaticum]|uniref:DsbA family oxidoreductase n=1 Tax=Pectobacterium aquaticum TaxID=2204145 RepID=A0AA93AIQ6_9GAMM|nr:DsbA family oxidoreductase [Pectobacterium aquaticum]RRO12403.1 DsbA family oxidoreductase [Pectobacterium aquaticum]
MKIEIWSDYACPYCYIGKRYMEQALAEFKHADDVEVIFKVFELDPSASTTVETTTLERIEHKYRKNRAQAQEMIDSIVSMGAGVGLDMRYDSVNFTNTFDAHRLTKFAEAKGKGAVMSERLFRAYFTDNFPLADHIVLTNIAVELGLDRQETEAMLASDAFEQAAREDEIKASKMGINSVPHFVIDGKQTLVGAQPKEYLLAALHQLWAKRETDLIPGISCGIRECN